MKRLVVQTKMFSDELDQLIREKKLLLTDYGDLERLLLENPEFGDLIKGAGGLRKIRLKSSTKGKRGGFRVCYYDFAEGERLYFIIIYGKNEQENISSKQLLPKGRSFIVCQRQQYAGGLHRQLTYRQIDQASVSSDLHSSRCAGGYHS